MRFTVVRIVMAFDVLLRESHNDELFESQWKDYYVQVDPLWVKLIQRHQQATAP
jgi:hypothetical protein